MNKIKWRPCLSVLLLLTAFWSCNTDKPSHKDQKKIHLKASDILGNPDYHAISYGGYRTTSRDTQPTLDQIKDDLRILHAMNVRVLRTYNVQFRHATTVVEAIDALKKEDSTFEMYVMLGAWIDCLNAWTEYPPDHNQEAAENNQAEIDRAIALANKYPDIVKVIAVGNEAMVKWATAYYVQPDVILKYVRQLQSLKKEGKLPSDLWITSSDNFASWGGGDSIYHVPALNDLIREVDFISLHTYPMHDTHYNPQFWGVLHEELDSGKTEQIKKAIDRAVQYAQRQYQQTVDYMKSIGVDKPVHIGETGWASSSKGMYGPQGSKATDEFKQGLFYEGIREWTDKNNISCFYFEAFDEPWKDAAHPTGSENHFGLFTVQGVAKYPVWKFVDADLFSGLSRDGNAITKSYDGDFNKLLEQVEIPQVKDSVHVQ